MYRFIIIFFALLSSINLKAQNVVYINSAQNIVSNAGCSELPTQTANSYERLEHIIDEFVRAAETGHFLAVILYHEDHIHGYTLYLDYGEDGYMLELMEYAPTDQSGDCGSEYVPSDFRHIPVDPSK